MADSADNALAQLEVLSRGFAQKLPQRAADISQMWETLTQNGYSADQVENLHRATHSLKGMGSTFGFQRITDIATALDNFAKRFVEQKNIGNAQDQLGFESLLNLLVSSAGSAQKDGCAKEPGRESKNVVGRPNDRRQWRLVGVVAPATDDYQHLCDHLRGNGYDVCAGPSLAAIKDQLASKLPSALLVDSDSCTKDELEGFYVRENVAREDIPILCVSCTDSFSDRLNAVRLGAIGYFPSSRSHDAITRQLDTQHSAAMADPYRVLIVDDEAALASHHAVLLRNAGMVTEIVSRPEQTFEAMETFNADVVLMDLYMPKCSGVELTSMIKLHEDYLNIPVIYLSAESDPKTQLTMLARSGGDDFLTKPIEAQTLVRAVKSRAARARRAESRTVLDRLTGALNLHATEMMLQNEVLRACQVNSHVSVALIDIDNFGGVEAEHGEKNANRVLRHFAWVARQECPNVPIGRFGEKEFVMVFFAVEPTQAQASLGALLEKFTYKRYKLPGNKMFAATASIGMASTRGCTDVEHLSQHAATCLFAAKDKGGGQIVAATLKTT